MAQMDEKIADFIAVMTAEIDDQITTIDNSKVMKAAQALIEKKTKLMAARRALLGGNTLTGGSSGTRIIQSDVAGYLTQLEGKGATLAQAAEALHTTEAVIRGHFNRGKDERFLKKNNLWYLRDPEAGVNNVEDIEEDE